MKPSRRLPLILSAVSVFLLTTVRGQEQCSSSFILGGQVIAHEQPCFCDDVQQSVLCQPSELCYSFPAGDPGSTTSLECFQYPCDDLNGRWIWYGRLPRLSSPGDFTVWGLVEVVQDFVCQHPTFNFTSLLVDSNGTTVVEPVTKSFYGLLSWREIYSFFLFDTPEQRDAYEQWMPSSSPMNNGEAFEEEITQFIMNQQNYNIFLQDFGNGAPREQCIYFGSFLYKGFTADQPNYDDENTNIYSGALAPDPDKKYQLGDVIFSQDIAPFNRNCPAGYPRNFSLEDSTTTVPKETTALPTTMTPSSGRETDEVSAAPPNSRLENVMAASFMAVVVACGMLC
jgi:hypothetical protein